MAKHAGPPNVLAGLIAIVLMTFHFSAQATLTWAGTEDNDFFNEANWSLDGGGSPAAGAVNQGTPIDQDIIIDTTDTITGVGNLLPAAM